MNWIVILFKVYGKLTNRFSIIQCIYNLKVGNIYNDYVLHKYHMLWWSNNCKELGFNKNLRKIN